MRLTRTGRVRARRGARPGARPGITLVELLIVVIMLGLVLGAVLTLLDRQQRFYQGAAAVMEARGQLRQATAVLPVELRGVATRVASPLVLGGSDFSETTPGAVTVRGTFGSSVICTKDAVSPTVFNLPPLGRVGPTGAQTVVTHWLERPQAGDTVWILDDGAAPHTGDDVWQAHTIASVADVAAGGTECARPILSANNAGVRYRVTVVEPLSATQKAGYPVRFTRRVRYAAYQAPDGFWYLGQQREVRPGGGLSPIQPVSGPYLPFDNGNAAASGLFFTYWDSTGVQVAGNSAADWQRVARVDVVARAQTEQAYRSAGGQRAVQTDQEDVTIAIRNRN